jgi:hypothetical protein
MFKRVLDTNFEGGHTNLKCIKIKIPIENFFKKLFEIGGGCGPFALGYILSPFGINRQKRSLLRALFTFAPMVQVNMSEDYTKVRVE